MNSSIRMLAALSLFAALIFCAPTDLFGQPGDVVPNLIDALREDGRFDKLLQLADETGVASELQAVGPFTLFAPTDFAFDGLADDESARLAADPDALRATLQHHVIPGEFSPYDLGHQGSISTALGSSLQFIPHGEELMVAGAIVEPRSLDAANGVIYVINRVLEPPDNAVRSESMGATDTPTPEPTATQSDAIATPTALPTVPSSAPSVVPPTATRPSPVDAATQVMSKQNEEIDLLSKEIESDATGLRIYVLALAAVLVAVVLMGIALLLRHF